VVVFQFEIAAIIGESLLRKQKNRGRRVSERVGGFIDQIKFAGDAFLRADS